MTGTVDTFEPKDRRYPFMYDAEVVDNDDPLGLGRVRVVIEGLVAKSNWAYPLGSLNGGTTRRGFFSVPEVGATVVVWFNQGRIEYPRYAAAYWGDQVEGAADDGGVGTQLPERVRDIPIEERKSVNVFETKKWVVVYDDRDGPTNEDGEPQSGSTGQNTLLIISKDDPNNFIEIDGHGRGIQISSTATLLLRSTGLVNIEGLTVQLAGRKVIQNGKPIT